MTREDVAEMVVTALMALLMLTGALLLPRLLASLAIALGGLIACVGVVA